MSMNDLSVVADPSIGDWIGPRLGGGFGAVGRTVPRGYPAYARILHAVEPTPPAEPTTWAGVCRSTGRVAHSLMQWASITTPAPAPRAGVELPLSSEGRWSGVNTQLGTLTTEVLSPLVDVLAQFTPDPEGMESCCLGLWEGWGWLTGSSELVVAFSEGPRPRPKIPVRRPSPDVLQDAFVADRLVLPGREYLLFAGPLRAAETMGDQVTDDFFVPQSPNLLWPADRSWFLASEIDFDSTLVGGSTELVAALLAAPDLEAWEVDVDDDLSSFGDQLNI